MNSSLLGPPCPRELRSSSRGDRGGARLRLWIKWSAAFLIAGTLSAVPEPALAASRRFQPERQLLVKCEGGPAGETARAVDTEVGAVRVRDFHALGWHVVGLPDGLSVTEAMARYRARPGILAVEPNAVVAVEPPVAANGEERMGNGEGSENSESREEATGAEQSLHSRFAIRDSPSTGVIPNDPRFNSQWNLRIIGMTNAWVVTTGSTNVVMAIIETGIDYDHEDLRENMWRNPGEAGLDSQGRNRATNGVDDDGNGYVDDVHGIDATDGDSTPLPGATEVPFGHGTGVAGVVGAVGNNGLGVTGINWNSRIMALRAQERDAMGRWVEIAGNAMQCIDYIVQMKRRGVPVAAVNNSYGLFVRSQAMTEAYAALGKEEILAVCSAGNQGFSADNYSQWPSGLDLPHVISVAASDPADRLRDFSNFGRSTVDLAAPSIVWTTARTTAQYRSDFGGTSSAAPHVTAAVALLRSVSPKASALELKGALMQSVDQRAAMQGRVTSNGRLNVANALDAITNAGLPPVVVGSFPASSRTRPDAPVELWFNKPMDRLSVESALQFTPSIQGRFEWSDGDRVLRILDVGTMVRTNYTCRLAGSARDSVGRGLDGDYDREAEGSPADDYVWSFGFAPANDEWRAAISLAGSEGSIRGTTVNAEGEIGEPLSGDAQFNPLSVWYSWTAPATGFVTFDLSIASTADFVLSVYSGPSPTDLIREAYNDNNGTRTRPRLSWLAAAGKTYSIDVAGKSLFPSGPVADAMGTFTLNWFPTPPPGIVGFSPSSGTPGSQVTLTGTNFTGVTRIRFNGTDARFATRPSSDDFYDLRLTAVVPADATTGPITIETPQGSGTSTAVFEVLEGPPSLLAVIEADRTLVLSWPTTAEGFVLETTLALGTSAWTPIGLPIEASASRKSVRILPDGTSRLFRLRKP